MGFDFFYMDFFGSSKRAGNEFVGVFYGLMQTKDGKVREIGEIILRSDQGLRCFQIQGKES